MRSRSWVIDFNRFSGKAQFRRATLSCDSSYLFFSISLSRYCWTSHDDFCSETAEHRHNVSVKFQISLTSAAGSGKLPRPDIMPEIENCVVHACGGCPDAGTSHVKSPSFEINEVIHVNIALIGNNVDLKNNVNIT